MNSGATVKQNESTSARQIILDEERHVAPEPRVHYINHTFEVPAGATKVGLILSFYKERVAQLFVSLHDPTGFRGNRMNPSAKGDIVLELWVAPNDASEGGIAGRIQAGTWRAQLDIERLKEETDYRLEAYVEVGEAEEVVSWNFPEDHVINPSPGWYQGELHAHSTESDGKYPVDTVVKAAQDEGLDFFSLTDHFTVSQWRKLVPLINDHTLLLRSCEVTSHQGHANLQGIKEWVDVYVDREGWSMDQVADAVHAQEGLFCVNHPFSGDLGWRVYDFDWDRADLMEIYHNLEGSNNAFHIGLWDHHLRLGRRLIGVGGIDSHDPFTGTHKLGQLVTWIYAPNLSEKGIIEGLRSGRVYVSRGPQLRFTANDGSGNHAEMWQSLPLGNGLVTFTLKVRAAEPFRVFLFKNGYSFESLTLESNDKEWQTVTFRDEPTHPTYYRVEIHTTARNEKYPGIEWRDHESMQVLSNPVWVGAPEKMQI